MTTHVPISSISSAMSMKRSCCHKFADVTCIALLVTSLAMFFPFFALGAAPKDSLMLITNYLAAVPEMVPFSMDASFSSGCDAQNFSAGRSLGASKETQTGC